MGFRVGVRVGVRVDAATEGWEVSKRPMDEDLAHPP